MRKWLLILAVLLCFLAGAIVPFAKQKSVREDTKKNFDASAFYREEPSGERAKIISQNGEALEERIRLISQAEREIILSTFEFDADTSGKKMLAALMEAANRGVKVSVLTDGFPYLTAMWGNPFFLYLAGMENVEIKVYNPVRLWKPWGFMGRLHDKYLLVDDSAYILGGRNTFDYFLGDQPGYKNYDWDVLVYTKESRGESSLLQVKEYFNAVWELPECRTLGKSVLWKKNPSVIRAGGELEEEYRLMQNEHGEWLEPTDYEKITVPVNHVSLLSNPTHIYGKEPVVFYQMTELMKQAEKEVIFHTPYIIADDWMLGRLQEVCQQVEKVTMMTNSVANNGNPFGAMDYQKYKGDILDTGVQVLEYDKGVSYHGKCFVMDERLSGIGSFNWDMRSAYLDTELMLVIDSRELNAQLRKEMGIYEQDALCVADAQRYDLKSGEEARKLSDKKKLRIKILEKTVGWARFLM